MISWALPLTLLVLAASLRVSEAKLETVVIGGDDGIEWAQEGNVSPTVIRSVSTVEQTNAPGAVIDFGIADRPNWIFPQAVDQNRNIMLGLESSDRGGSLFTPTLSLRSLEPQFSRMIDDDGDTALEVRPDRAGESTRASGFIIQFDLGAVFALNRLRFFPRNADPDYPSTRFPNQKDFLKSFEIFQNDGAPESESSGILIFETLEIVPQNEEQVVDLRIGAQFVRHLRLKVLTNTEFEIAEFQAFAQGFVPKAQYVSNVFDFGSPALLGNIRWIQEQQGDPLQSRMQIRTRTGIDAGTVVFPRVGLQSSGRVDQTLSEGDFVEVDIPIEALWKRAEEFDGSSTLETPAVFGGNTLRTLQEIVSNVLDNPDLDGRDVMLFYNDLPLDVRASLEIDENYYRREVDNVDRRPLKEDLTNWSPWSAPYPPSAIVDALSLANPGAGTVISSPDPRRYFQFMVDFSNDSFDAATGLGGLSFDVQTPAYADSLIAEVLPRSAGVGERTRFIYAVLNKTSSNAGGFDQIEIDTPIETERVRGIRIDRSESSLAADFSDTALDNLPATIDGISIEEVRDDGFIISFPKLRDPGLITVEFDNAVLRVGTQFTGRALNSQNILIGQEVIPGNAADLGTTDLVDPDSQPVGSLNAGNLSVNVPIIRDLLVNVEPLPAVFSPNGDGTNDQTLLFYDITNIAELRPIEIEIFDLSGRRLLKLYDGEDLSGRFAYPWDGRDSSGHLVPPGNYLFAVSLAAKTGTVRQIGIVGVAY